MGCTNTAPLRVDAARLWDCLISLALHARTAPNPHVKRSTFRLPTTDATSATLWWPTLSWVVWAPTGACNQLVTWALSVATSLMLPASNFTRFRKLPKARNKARTSHKKRPPRTALILGGLGPTNSTTNGGVYGLARSVVFLGHDPAVKLAGGRGRSTTRPLRGRGRCSRARSLPALMSWWTRCLLRPSMAAASQTGIQPSSVDCQPWHSRVSPSQSV